MITICYQCRREVDGSGIAFGKTIDVEEHQEVSHGICAQCAKAERSRLDEEATDLLRKKGM